MSDELLSAVLALPPGQRAALAHRILESLEAPAEAGVENAWVVELERRARDLAEGKANAVSWPEARVGILEELKRRRAARSAS